MEFSHDDDTLSLSIELDDAEADGHDLTAGLLGQKILDAAVTGMTDCFASQISPDGDQWVTLRPATIRAKGHDLAGVRSGAMLADLHRGFFDVQPRTATWSFPAGATFARAFYFHNGSDAQAPRPFVGWTDSAEAEANRLLSQS